ncbi:Hypothetical protein PHPALM_2403 [Phytophthora palmivora]|uniref:Uncharacterized protein n=1 Tax=Phytophthora palmivora TaxID=4796 RepID=A0A2P4YPW7_9STRA|nr:Hypothetical protein PHPALM_2403 [Phytophthora palmivora]
MEKKSKSFTYSRPKNDSNAASSPPPPPSPRAHTFGYSGTHVVANAVGRRGWRPEPGGGRHDSPLFSRHRKLPSAIESNESEATVKHNDPQETKATKPDGTPVPPLALTPAINTRILSVQPPRTPQGRATYTTFDGDGGLSAAQRVRMELTTHSGSRAGSGARANSSEDISASNSAAYDEKNGPRSCPSTFNDGHKVRTELSPGTRRHVRSGELIVSKLLPTRDSVNSLLTYLHELQISEASLRKQLMSTKRHTEEGLFESLSKLNELQHTMQEVERDRRQAQQRLEEKDKRIRELAAKLERAEARSTRSPSNDGLPSIADEQRLVSILPASACLLPLFPYRCGPYEVAGHASPESFHVATLAFACVLQAVCNLSRMSLVNLR